MNVSGGALLRSRVVSDVSEVLEAVLDEGVTGYARIEPGDALLLDAEDRGVLTFERGVPVAAYHAGTDRAGTDALRDLSSPGPYRVELYELDGEVLRTVHEDESVRVPPDDPARRLANDPTLAEETRTAAPEDRLDETEDDADALAEFLADEERIEAIREQAREQAEARAEEWGLSAVLADEDPEDREDS